MMDGAGLGHTTWTETIQKKQLGFFQQFRKTGGSVCDLLLNNMEVFKPIEGGGDPEDPGDKPWGRCNYSGLGTCSTDLQCDKVTFEEEGLFWGHRRAHGPCRKPEFLTSEYDKMTK